MVHPILGNLSIEGRVDSVISTIVQEYLNAESSRESNELLLRGEDGYSVLLIGQAPY